MSALILKAANEFSVLFLGTSRSDDSTGDRLSYRYTTAILIAFTVIVSNREFTSKRIQCWVPAFFTGNYEDYTNNVCWVRNTYYVGENKQIPESAEDRHETSIRYYQWIPFILLSQAFFFFLPYVLWRALCERSGIDLRDIVEAASSYKKASDEKQRERLMKFIISAIDQYCDDPRRQSNNRETVWWKKIFLVVFPSSGRYMGDYLRNLFLFIKIVYLLNVLTQIVLLTFLLGQPFWSLGFTVIQMLYEGKSWDYTSRYFPKVTLCDFEIREANALPIAHTYTVMCVLPINLFNQQIFTFLWFWFVIVILISIYDLGIWVYRLFFRREGFIEDRLKVMDYIQAHKWPFKAPCKDHFDPKENELIMRLQSRDESVMGDDYVSILSDGRKIHHQSRMYTVPLSYYQGNKQGTLFDFFIEDYLEADGIFILGIIATNASQFVSTKIIHELYIKCCEKRFRANLIKEVPPMTRRTLYKYLVIPKDDPPPPPPTTSQEQPRTPTFETRPNSNPFASQPPPPPPPPNRQQQQQQPPEARQRTLQNPSYAPGVEHGIRPRSGTFPFIQDMDEQPLLFSPTSGAGTITSRRPQHRPRQEQREGAEDDDNLV